MKKYFSSLIFVLFFSGCATSFVPFANLASVGDSVVNDSDLKLTIGIQQLGDNSRFKDNAEKSRISVLKLTVENISDNIVSLSGKNIYIRDSLSDAPVSPLSTEEVYDRMSLASGIYFFWSILWIGFYQNNNGETSSFWFPLGLPIGTINYLRARKTNSNFKEEITKNAFPDVELAPSESRTGLLFFKDTWSEKHNLIVEYVDRTGNKKEAIIEYKF